MKLNATNQKTKHHTNTPKKWWTSLKISPITKTPCVWKNFEIVDSRDWKRGNCGVLQPLYLVEEGWCFLQNKSSISAARHRRKRSYFNNAGCCYCTPPPLRVYFSLNLAKSVFRCTENRNFRQHFLFGNPQMKIFHTFWALMVQNVKDIIQLISQQNVCIYRIFESIILTSHSYSKLKLCCWSPRKI